MSKGRDMVYNGRLLLITVNQNRIKRLLHLSLGTVVIQLVNKTSTKYMASFGTSRISITSNVTY